MIRFLPLAFALLSSPCFAVVQHEFGPGLHYLRVTDLTKDSAELQKALSQESLVLDLRFARSTPDAATVLASKLDEPPPGKNGFRLILINPSSAAEITEALARARPREITIGPKTPALRPDIVVPATVEEDREAYEALNRGTPIEKLISSNLEKRRYDEASLARTHGNGASTEDHASRDETPDTTSAKSEKPTAPRPAIPPPDLVLTRALQIYRALLSAKK